MLAAQEGADCTKLLRVAVAPGRNLRLLDHAQLFHGFARFLVHGGQGGADVVSVQLFHALAFALIISGI
jgi:hypothetical protein